MEELREELKRVRAETAAFMELTKREQAKREKQLSLVLGEGDADEIVRARKERAAELTARYGPMYDAMQQPGVKFVERHEDGTLEVGEYERKRGRHRPDEHDEFMKSMNLLNEMKTWDDRDHYEYAKYRIWPGCNECWFGLPWWTRAWLQVQDMIGWGRGGVA